MSWSTKYCFKNIEERKNELKKKIRPRFKHLANFSYYDCQIQPKHSYGSRRHSRGRHAWWRKLEGLKSQCWNWKQSANSNAALWKYRMFSFPFFTMRHFFYSLLFWSKTNVLNSQSPNCCGLLLIYISYEWIVIQIAIRIKLQNVQKIVWQSLMSPASTSM